MTELRKARQAQRQSGQRKLFPVRLVDMETVKAWECFDADGDKDARPSASPSRLAHGPAATCHMRRLAPPPWPSSFALNPKPGGQNPRDH